MLSKCKNYYRSFTTLSRELRNLLDSSYKFMTDEGKTTGEIVKLAKRNYELSANVNEIYLSLVI